MLVLLYILCFGAAAAGGVLSYPPVTERIARYLRERAEEGSEQLGDMFMDLSQHTVLLSYMLSPLVVGLLFWLLTMKWFIGLFGVLVGILIPRLVIARMHVGRRKLFHSQLVDGLLLMSSSLKAGLSMMQAFTVLVEEMPPPITQEFGLVLKETRMGVNLEEAMLHLKERIPTDEVHLFVTAVLVARETGGDVTRVFQRLVETLRERKKLKERISTLTFMARMQGIIMAMLPFVFAFLVYQMNHDYFTFFIIHPMGRMMLLLIVFLQTASALMFMRFSRSPLGGD